jgi:hypothetical protein
VLSTGLLGRLHLLSLRIPFVTQNMARRFNFTCLPPIIVTDLGEDAALELRSSDIRRDVGVEGCGDLLECLEQRDDPKMDNLYAPLTISKDSSAVYDARYKPLSLSHVAFLFLSRNKITEQLNHVGCAISYNRHLVGLKEY